MIKRKGREKQYLDSCTCSVMYPWLWQGVEGGRIFWCPQLCLQHFQTHTQAGIDVIAPYKIAQTWVLMVYKRAKACYSISLIMLELK